MMRAHRSQRSTFQRVMFALLIISLPASLAAAGDAQPDALRFGTVPLGAIVEGSVRVWLDPADARGQQVNVGPPPFLVVKDVKLGTQKYGADERGYCDLRVSLNTRSAGEFSGDLRVEAGGRRIAVPIAATVRPPMRGQTQLLVLSTPFTSVSASDATVFDRWLKLVDDAGLDVQYLDVQPSQPVLGRVDLEEFDVLLLGTNGLLALADRDIKLLRAFVERGGRIIVFANASFLGTVDSANRLLGPCGLRMMNVNPRQTGPVQVGPRQLVRDPLTARVQSLFFQRSSPVEITDRRRAKILAAVPGHPDQGLAAIARAGRGDVAIICDALSWNWVAADRDRRSSNAILLEHLVKQPARRK